MISSIKNWMFQKALVEHPNFKEKSKFSGVNHCNSYCILTTAHPPSLHAVKLFKSKLEKDKKSVDIIVFENTKSPSNIGYSRKDITWSGVPSHPTIEECFAKTYDVFLFLCPQIENHLRFIADLLKARLKVGPAFPEAYSIFDLMVEDSIYTDTQKLLDVMNQQLNRISI